MIRTDHQGVLIAVGIVDGYCRYTWSFDGGVTWADSLQVSLDLVDDEQPGLVELPDGALRIALTQGDAVRIYSSENAGESWTVVGVLT